MLQPSYFTGTRQTSPLVPHAVRKTWRVPHVAVFSRPMSASCLVHLVGAACRTTAKIAGFRRKLAGARQDPRTAKRMPIGSAEMLFCQPLLGIEPNFVYSFRRCGLVCRMELGLVAGRCKGHEEPRTNTLTPVAACVGRGPEILQQRR